MHVMAITYLMRGVSADAPCLTPSPSLLMLTSAPALMSSLHTAAEFDVTARYSGEHPDARQVACNVLENLVIW